MTQLREHPLRTLTGLLVLAFCCFMLSGIPALRDAKSGINLVLGDIVWFGFLTLALLFVVGGVMTLVRVVSSPRSAA